MLFSEHTLLIQHGGQPTLFIRRANGRKSSTIYDLDKAAIESFGTILIITLSGIEDIFAQTLHTRIFYAAKHFLFHRRFANIFTQHQNRGRMIDDTLFHEIEQYEN